LNVRILILNWRDSRHPRAGGAEFHTHELARRLVQSGCEVEWFAASFPGASSSEVIDGVQVIRKGRQWTVHARAFLHYRKHLRARFDVVIDQVNTIPFFTPLWADVPILMMIWQLAREVWWYESRFPISVFGFALEPLYLRLYRHTPVLTYSESTRSDLTQLGFTSRISVAPIGIDQFTFGPVTKSIEPTFVYVGRVAPSKRIHHILRALALFRETTGTGRLLVIGSGPLGYRVSLDRLAAKLQISSHIEFCGWLRGEEKYRRMGEARALILTSAREGWGLVVTECNACGTPAIVYDVSGLRDSVRNGETGLVVPPSPDHLARAMERLVGDDGLYRALQSNGLRWARSLTHQASASMARQVIELTTRSELRRRADVVGTR
jgi:glycosyltransferase involved in cell wall biosynthesis